MSDNLIKLAGLFECESKAGNKYFTGLLNHGTKLVMLKNKHREAENQPHWVLYLTERNGKKPADTQSHGATPPAPAAEDAQRESKRRSHRADQKELAIETQAPFDDDLPADLA